MRKRKKVQLQKIVDEIKENGAYYKGAFGTDQYFYYKVLEAKIVSDEITCKIEKIVLFNSLGINSSCINKNSFSYEFDQKDFVNYEDITFRTTRITDADYNELKDYLFGVVPKFFPTEWNERQKEYGIKSEN